MPWDYIYIMEPLLLLKANRIHWCGNRVHYLFVVCFGAILTGGRLHKAMFYNSTSSTQIKTAIEDEEAIAIP